MMSADEIKIRRAFKEKNWNAIKTSDSWQIFKEFLRCDNFFTAEFGRILNVVHTNKNGR